MIFESFYADFITVYKFASSASIYVIICFHESSPGAHYQSIVGRGYIACFEPKDVFVIALS